jgi:hypothetical protein
MKSFLVVSMNLSMVKRQEQNNITYVTSECALQASAHPTKFAHLSRLNTQWLHHAKLNGLHMSLIYTLQS